MECSERYLRTTKDSSCSSIRRMPASRIKTWSLGVDADHARATADLLFDVLERVCNRYEKVQMRPVTLDRLDDGGVPVGEYVQPSGTGASESRRRSGRPVFDRWARARGIRGVHTEALGHAGRTVARAARVVDAGSVAEVVAAGIPRPIADAVLAR